jgi:Spy/CpxP family protein refolding chaperone
MKYRNAMLVLTLLLGSDKLGAQQIAPWKFLDPLPQATRPAILEDPELNRLLHNLNALPGVASGRWWHNPQTAARLSLTPDQQKKMDDVFQQSRLKLIDLTAALDKEEAILEPLVEADQPDAPKIRVQIDRIAQARAELEKANANMLLGIRLILTPDQWKSLQSGGGGGPRARRLKDMSNDSPTQPPVPKKK